MRRALRLRPEAVLVEQDVAEDDVGAPVRLDGFQRAAEGGVVGLPTAAAGDAPQAEPLRLCGQQFGPQAVRSAARRALVEHRDHAGHVVLRVRAVEGGATVLAAAPGNGGARLASRQGVLLSAFSAPKHKDVPGGQVF